MMEDKEMQILKDRIRKDGKIREGNVLKVDSFLNHQMDVSLFREIGKEFKRRFEGEEITKILTIEASGIGIACVVAEVFNVPVVFAKKTQTKNIAGDVYTTQVESYTHGRIYDIIVSREFLGPDDKVLLIDDFMANGKAMEGLIQIVKDSGAQLVGAGIVIEKGFQPGGDALRVGADSLRPVDKPDHEACVLFVRLVLERDARHGRVLVVARDGEAEVRRLPELARVGAGEHRGDGGEKAVFIGIEEPDGVFRVLGQGVEKNEIVRGIGAVGLRLRLGGAEEGDGLDGLELGHGAGQAGVDQGRADVPRRAQLQPERQDAILQRLDRAGIAGGEGQRERFVLRAMQIGLEQGGGVGLRRDFLRAQYTGLRVAAVFAAVVELQLGLGGPAHRRGGRAAAERERREQQREQAELFPVFTHRRHPPLRSRSWGRSR